MNLDEQVKYLSCRFGYNPYRVSELLALSRGKQMIKHSSDYLINKKMYDERAYVVVERYLRFNTYMAVGRD